MNTLPVPLLAIAALLLLPPSSPGYQPPLVVPGETWTATVVAVNPSGKPMRTSARARFSGHRFWSGPEEAAIHGRWTEIPPVTLEAGEGRTLAVPLEVPARAVGVLGIEFEVRGTARWMAGARWALPLVEGTAGEGPGRIPFRLVAGGQAIYDEGQETNGFVLEVVRDADELAALRERLGIVYPDSWGLYPNEADAPPPIGGNAALFAASTAPDFATETLLAVRIPEYSAHVWPRRLCFRSVTTRADGTLLCRYSYRYRRVRGLVFGIMSPGEYVLAAIPKTDAPVEFRRVP